MIYREKLTLRKLQVNYFSIEFRGGLKLGLIYYFFVF